MKLYRTLAITMTLFVGGVLSAQNNVTLDEGFIVPPESAKPRTWWHWTNSNITKEGITKDLEWMKRVGIGGMQMADVGSGSGQVVEEKIVFGSPEWYDAVKHTAQEADRLGLEFTMFSSAGWSLTGGTWVKPEQAMKKLVWSELQITGSQEYSGKLPEPPSVDGPFKDIPRNNPPVSSFYKDFKVLAFPTPADDLDDNLDKPTVTSSSTIKADALLDDNLVTSETVRPAKNEQVAWVQYSYDTPVTAQALTIGHRSSGVPVGVLKVSDDGVTYKTVAYLQGALLYRAGKVKTIAFPKTTAKYFRVEFTASVPSPEQVMAETVTQPDSVYYVGELKLHKGARINRWEDKAGFYHLFNYDAVKSEDVPSSSVIDPSTIIDITDKMSADGTLNWKVPKGNWTVMRFGYSLTGATNRPAVPAALGLEVDKLSKEHTIAYIKGFTDPVANSLGTLYGKGLQYILLDSWEAGMQNWTDNMMEEFADRRGYEMTSYLPCLTGRVISNSDVSDRFLWDFRRTLADMFAENHFKTITDYLHDQGLKTYGEVSGVSLEILEDLLLSKKYVDIPMGEFWFQSLHPFLMYHEDVRGAASAAHVYGKTLVGAESFTGGAYASPSSLKDIGDYWFAQGINRFIFHTSAHQPLDTKPGNTMVGTHINRNITWAEQAKPFMTYLSRNMYMLQQGLFVADLAYMLDESAPSTVPIWGTGLTNAPPEGYDFDYVNADVILNRFTVAPDGRLTLPDGMSYSLLVLPNCDHITIPVLKKIHELVKQGATIVGPKPTTTPGLTNYPESEEVVEELVMDIWGDLDGIGRTRRPFGKGWVYWGRPIDKVLEDKQIQPDFEYERALDSKIEWLHRRSNDVDIYFVTNDSDRQFETNLRFRVGGKQAEIWDPMTGSIRPASYTIDGDKTIVPVSMDEHQSLFVVFRNTASDPVRVVKDKKLMTIQTLEGGWDVTFQPELGAPDKAHFDELQSWTENEDDGIKYFSGTATYSKVVSYKKKELPTGELILDLGLVADIAEVSVNGQPVGQVWHTPFQVDITGLLNVGDNTIEVKVTNEWTNRMAGDRIVSPDKAVLSVPRMSGRSSLFAPTVRLQDSGLLGPVTIKRIVE